MTFSLPWCAGVPVCLTLPSCAHLLPECSQAYGVASIQPFRCPVLAACHLPLFCHAPAHMQINQLAMLLVVAWGVFHKLLGKSFCDTPLRGRTW